MSNRLVTILIVALAAYGLGFLVAMQINRGSFPAYRGQAVGRALVSKAPRSTAAQANALPTPDFEYVPSEVKAGQAAAIRIKTQPGQICTIWVMSSGQPIPNLPTPIYQAADADGHCGWQWTISPDSEPAIATACVWAGGKPFQRSFRIVR